MTRHKSAAKFNVTVEGKGIFQTRISPSIADFPGLSGRVIHNARLIRDGEKADPGMGTPLQFSGLIRFVQVYVASIRPASLVAAKSTAALFGERELYETG